MKTNKWMAAAMAVGGLLCGCQKKAPPPPAPPKVEVMEVQPQTVPVFEEWIGTMDGLVNAQIHSQVTGYLTKLAYAEGAKVKRGDLLFEVDPRPFQAAVGQAEAKLAQDQAQAEKTALDVKRYTPLAKEQAVSEETAIDAVQAHLAAVAQVKADEASLETAKLNLDWTRVTSPVDGVAGIALAQVGDLVGPSGPLLTTVSTVDPIKVYFQVNEESYLRFWQKYVSTMDTNSQDLSLDLKLSDGSTYPHKGRFYSADRQINIATGTLQIVAAFPNPDAVLRPGQYAQVRTMTSLQSNVYVVPQRAVKELQGTYEIAVITAEGNGASNVAHLRPVKVGRQIGPNWLVEDGLNPGDHVVVEGILKAQEGKAVAPEPLGSGETNATAGTAVAANSGATNSSH